MVSYESHKDFDKVRDSNFEPPRNINFKYLTGTVHLSRFESVYAVIFALLVIFATVNTSSY